MEVIKINKPQEQEWALNVGNKTIPLSLIASITKLPFLLMLIAIAYNLGQHDAQEYLKWLSAFHGVCDPLTGQCQTCYAMLIGNQVNWICEFQNKTTTQGFNAPMLNISR